MRGKVVFWWNKCNLKIGGLGVASATVAAGITLEQPISVLHGQLDCPKYSLSQPSTECLDDLFRKTKACVEGGFPAQSEWPPNLWYRRLKNFSSNQAQFSKKPSSQMNRAALTPCTESPRMVYSCRRATGSATSWDVNKMILTWKK